MLRFNNMILTVMTVLCVLVLSCFTVSLCVLCKTALCRLGLWVIYNLMRKLILFFTNK
jgi:hypothetical protein